MNMPTIRQENGQFYVNGQRVLYTIVRHKKRGRIGAVAALNIDGHIKVGYALCDKTDQQKGKFTTQGAVEIAIARCLKKDITLCQDQDNNTVFFLPPDEHGKQKKAPHTIQNDLQRLYIHAHKKFHLELPPEQEQPLIQHLTSLKKEHLARLQRQKDREYNLLWQLKQKFEPLSPEHEYILYLQLKAKYEPAAPMPTA